ncbi:T9SS type A sorting domain-containing protein [Carboxylicivirga sp. N1Y90]|uniref:T9SS type A sorting domain-containing protein n=1 Tax=Carboxylicivirga fragile TaxID=3417571 RepID=UPI003D349C52|nr:T9SS type A sorting domain-containing protein [Marinilabiliaceae bacterium N1Y90]
MNHTLLVCSLFILFSAGEPKAQNVCDENDKIVLSSRVIPFSSYALIPSSNVGGSMFYCSAMMNANHGGGFQLDYIDTYDGGMDGYPNVRAGGSKVGGQWIVGEKAVVGMPVQIKDIHPNMSFVWESTQTNALDADDKWMSSINFIFDINGSETSEPINAERDYDLVVKAQSHNFSDDLNDQAEVLNNKIYFFARNTDGSLKPYELTLDGLVYTYAIRYKFFVDTGDKDDKAHIKLIPYGSNGAPSVANINIKHLIATTKDYIQYAAIPEPYLSLAHEKIAGDNTWLKAIAAGYEVYTGESTLKVDQFKLYPEGDNTTSIFHPENEKRLSVYPNPSNGLFYIKGARVESIAVFNIQGQCLCREFYAQELDLSFLSAGQYYMQLTTTLDYTEVHKIQVL